MSSELSMMMNENGGNILWVQRAFGDFLGWVNAFNNMIQGMCSSAILGVLFVDYFRHPFPLWQRWLIQISFISFNTILNIAGLQVMSVLSVVFLFFVFSPFITEAAILIHRDDVHVYKLEEIPHLHEVDWSLFLSTTIWALDGMDQMGSLAGEVKGGTKTFIAGILMALPLIFTNYFFPIFISYSVASNWKKWDTGYFTDVAYDVKTKHHFLGIWMTVASAVSNFGQFNSSVSH